MALELIEQARGQGARESLACDVLGLSCRTLRRWRASSCTQSARLRTAERLQAQHAGPTTRSAMRNGSKFFRPATARNFKACPRRRLFPFWQTAVFTLHRNPVFTGYCMNTDNPIVGARPIDPTPLPDQGRGKPASQTRCGAGTSPFCPRGLKASFCACTW